MLSNRLALNISARVSLFLFLNLADYLVTVYMVNTGRGFEGNAIFGNSLIVAGALKLLGSVFVLKYFRDNRFVMWGVIIGLVLVCTWNLSWLVVLW